MYSRWHVFIALVLLVAGGYVVSDSGATAGRTLSILVSPRQALHRALPPGIRFPALTARIAMNICSTYTASTEILRGPLAGTLLSNIGTEQSGTLFSSEHR